MSLNSQNDIKAMLSKGFKTIKEMLTDRGVSMENIEHVTEEELYIFYDQNNIFSINVNPTFKIIFNMPNKIDKNFIKPHIIPETDKHIIFVSNPTKSNTSNTKYLDEFRDEYGITIEFFKISELQYNPYFHEYVPQHILIRDSNTIDKLQKHFKLTNKNQFPIIYSSDVIARYFNLKSGEMMKIIQPGITSGEYNTYRYCV
jgi:DNA-directed RNA polymerase subunit H (RpoH/RPB5)/plasmid maintenance system killer protein